LSNPSSNSALRPSPHILRRRAICVDSESFSELVEVNVARFNQSPVEVDSSMSLLPPASMNVRSHCKGAVAKDLFVGINNPFLQTGKSITILKVDPGGYCPAIALFWRGWSLLRSNSSTVPCRRPAEIDWDQRQGYSPWRGSPGIGIYGNDRTGFVFEVPFCYEAEDSYQWSGQDCNLRWGLSDKTFSLLPFGVHLNLLSAPQAIEIFLPLPLHSELANQIRRLGIRYSPLLSWASLISPR